MCIRDRVLAGKSHVKPNSVFDWTYYFPKVNNRYLPLKKVDDYLQNVKKPFCLILASDFPHGPYPKNTKYSKSDIYKLPYDPNYIGNHKPGYYQNIEDDNDQLGEVLKMVDEHNLKDNSLFIYASDHGLSGKWSLQEQGLKVPFIARWPSKIKANSTSETMLSLVDVLPTILEITNTKIPEDIDGRRPNFHRNRKREETYDFWYVSGKNLHLEMRKIIIFIQIFGLSIFNICAQRTEQPNILLIMLDDVSPDLYGAYGLPQAVNTPNVDKLASEGVMFKTCYASAMCGPSRVQIMTGKYGSSTGVTHNSMWLGDSKQNVYKDHQAIGKLLKDAGYATAIAGKWHAGRSMPYEKDVGFEEYCLWESLKKIEKLPGSPEFKGQMEDYKTCLLYTSDAADE